MPDEILELFTRQYIQAQQVPEVTFAWQGGEPTLAGIDFLDKALSFQRKYQRPGMVIHNTLQTNATLLDENWAEFLRDNHFLVGVSLDGPALIHDAYRIDKGGQPTFDRVLAGLDILKRKRVEYNILACVHKLSVAQPLEVYHFLRDEVGAQFIQFIPIVERCETQGNLASTRSVNDSSYGNFLISIFDEWVRRDVGRVFIQIFEVAFSAWSGYRPGLCVHEEICGQAMALEHNGDLYSCDHFVAPAFKLGNITEQDLSDLAFSNKQHRFGKNKKLSLPKDCCTCKVYFVCHGGCPKDRLFPGLDGEPALNYLCVGYKAFFTHINQSMRIMVDLFRRGRAPSEIMSMLPAGGRKRHLLKHPG